MATPLLPPSKKEGKIVGKKISTGALFGKNKKSSAIIKSNKSSITLRPKLSSSIIRAPKKDSESSQISSDKNLISEFKEVKNEFFGIKNTLNGISELFVNEKKQRDSDIKNERKEEEKRKKRNKEAELEKPKTPLLKGVKAPSIPKFNFLDSIINFFGSILLGSLLNFLLSKKNFIFTAFNDITKGFDNIFNVIKFSIISLSNTAGNLIKSVGQVGAKLFKGPAKFTLNLLKNLGKSVSNLLIKAGKAIGNFVKGTFKNVSNLATGVGYTRATGVAKRIDPSKAKAAGKPITKPRIPKQTNTSVLKRSEKLFGERGAKHLGKVSKVFKKIPFIGALIGIGIDLAMGERLDNAIAGAAGATLGAAIGGAIGTVALPIPGVGSFLGGVIGAAIGDWAGKEIYRNISGQISQINPPLDDVQERPTQPDTTPIPGGAGGGGISSGAIPAEGKALLDAIAGAESGGYNARYPSKTFSGYADHPRISEPTRDGRTSDAAGRYQFLSTTWDKYKPAKAFTPENQDIAAWRLAVAVYGYGEQGLVNALKKDPMEVARKLRGTWPSLPGGSQQNVHTSGYISRYRNALKKYQGGVLVGPSQNKGLTYQTNTYRNQYYGAPREGGRKHAGVDIQMYSNSKQITFLGGRVINIANDPGGYYKYIDILTPTGKIERLAELGRLDPAVKRGAVLAPGQIVSYGVGPTGVTHLEYRNPGTSGFSGTVNPLEYLRSIGSIFGGDTFAYKGGVGGRVSPQQLTPSVPVARVPRQTSQSLSTRAGQLTQQASYEGQQQIIPIPVASGEQSLPIIIGGGGGGGLLPVGMSKRESLNSYYQSQLIGFLYKQG